MGQDVAGLPIGVVRSVVHQVIPHRNVTMEVPRAEVVERSRLKVEAIAVASSKLKGLRFFGGQPGTRSSPGGQVLEGVHDKRSMHMDVVATEPVGLGRLRRDSYERWMRVD